MAAPLALGCVTSGSSPSATEHLELANSRFNLGVDYIRKDFVELGLRELLSAETLDPANARIKNAIGDAYRIKGKTEDAATVKVMLDNAWQSADTELTAARF